MPMTTTRRSSGRRTGLRKSMWAPASGDRVTRATGGGCSPWFISYGPNLMMMTGYSKTDHPTTLAQLSRPADKIALAEAIVGYGCCESWNSEYFRGANYSGADNGWKWADFRKNVGQAKKLGITDAQMSSVTRHALGNTAIFADG